MRGKGVEPVFAPLTRRIASECFGKPQMRQTDSTARTGANASAPNHQRFDSWTATRKKRQAYRYKDARWSLYPANVAMREVS
jgi:hypothetical protein